MNVNKPCGWTSHDVVARVRRLAGQKRVGHAGTLDPLAEGVLPVLLGRATRLADYIQLGQKTYVAEVRLGVGTETDDGEGAIISEQPVPWLTGEIIEAALRPFTGEILQTPPKYSALKVGGQRAYALARSGAAVDLAARAVTIHGLRLLSYSADTLELEVSCSKGTYIRALARDLAVALGTVGHLRSLRRTRVGPFSFASSLTPDDLAARGISSSLLGADAALPSAPKSVLAEADTQRFVHGQPIPTDGLQADAVWVYDPDGHLIGLGVADGVRLRPHIAL